MTPALLPVPELTLDALGTRVRAVGSGAFAALNEVRRQQGRLTRFRPSPLTRLNEHGELHDPYGGSVALVMYTFGLRLLAVRQMVQARR
ncbi:hypothetical protein [Deinococcus sp.]|uniref:hypothetical protein n=1 Tax=Deinococcus sp. TaxID=47478 RepID=UPI0028699C19|nr:hypothetical protein [Deinococcus sp.]